MRLQPNLLGQTVSPLAPGVSVQDWFTELPRISLNPGPHVPHPVHPQPFHVPQPQPPPLAHFSDPATIIEVGSSPPPAPSQHRLRQRKQPRQPVMQPAIVPRLPSPHSLSSAPSPSPPPKIPSKRKSKASTEAEQVTEVYGLFIEIPKKPSTKKGRPSYDQYGPWEFQTSLSWAQFCGAIAKHMNCTPTALDADSFSWRQKSTGTSTNVSNEFGYGQMISRIHVMRPKPVPNVYLIMNLPRASGRRPVSVHTLCHLNSC